MNFKKIALAAAAAAAATPAMAADLPVVAEPVNYVEACSAYGNGFFKLPGQETCIRLHGRIRTQITSHDLTEDYDAATNGHSSYAKGYLYFDSMTQTELASIKTYMEIESKWDDASKGTLEAGSAYVQFGFDTVSVLLGRTGSTFDTFGGYSEVGVVGITSGGEDNLQLSTTAALGNGFTAAFALEDSQAYGGAANSVDFVGALSLTQGIFSAGISGAAHAYDDGEFGYAAAAKVEIAATDAVKFGFGATYAIDALAYAGGKANHSVLDENDRRLASAADAAGSDAYVLAAGVEYAVTDTVTLALDGSYADYEVGTNLEYSETIINGSVAYKPVAGLTLALDAGWADGELKFDDEKFDLEGAKVAGRVQYSF